MGYFFELFFFQIPVDLRCFCDRNLSSSPSPSLSPSPSPSSSVRPLFLSLPTFPHLISQRKWKSTDFFSYFERLSAANGDSFPHLWTSTLHTSEEEGERESEGTRRGDKSADVIVGAEEEREREEKVVVREGVRGREGERGREERERDEIIEKGGESEKKEERERRGVEERRGEREASCSITSLIAGAVGWPFSLSFSLSPIQLILLSLSDPFSLSCSFIFLFF